MKSDLVLLGNSPFIQILSLTTLLEQYTVFGFNGIGQYYPVDAVFCFDRWYEPGMARRIFHPHYIHPPIPCATATAFDPKPSAKPIMDARQAGRLVLGFKYFSPSVALNWALLSGFKRIYLVGIDHVETDRKFAHHDGAECRSELTPKSHQGFKQYVYNCAKYAEIYQCNPAVKSGWDLPFKDIGSLYVSQSEETKHQGPGG